MKNQMFQDVNSFVCKKYLARLNKTKKGELSIIIL